MNVDLWLRYYETQEAAQASAEKSLACEMYGHETQLFDRLALGRQCNHLTYSDGLVVVPVYCRNCEYSGHTFTLFYDDLKPFHWPCYTCGEDYSHIDPEHIGGKPLLHARLPHALRNWCSRELTDSDYLRSQGPGGQ
ncbi:MAG: hypothetical protein NVS3B3_13840 [Aquirhabdus sp.]